MITDGQTGRWKDRQTERQTNERTLEWTDEEETDRQMGIRNNRWICIETVRKTAQ
jgi:hypothetical protein